MWFIYSLLSALFHSFKSISEKVFVSKMDTNVLSFSIRLSAFMFFSLLILTNLSLLNDIQNLPIGFWVVIVFITFIETPIEMYLFYKALKYADVSYIMPFVSLNPLLTVLWNYLLFKDAPSAIGFLGIILLVVGIYVLNTDKSKISILAPFKNIANNKSARLILIMVIFYSFGYIGDKYCLQFTNAYTYSFINYALLSSSLLIIALIKSRDKFPQIKRHVFPLILTGIFIFIYSLFRFTALKEYNAGYVSAVASVSVVLVVFWSHFYLKEKDFIKKLIASIIIFIGLVLIKLFS